MPFSGSISRDYTGARSVSGVSSIEGSINRKLTAKRAVAGVHGSLSGTIVAIGIRFVAGVLAMTGTLTRKLTAARDMDGTLDQSGSLARKLAAKRDVSGSLGTFEGIVLKKFLRVVAGSLGALSGSLTRKSLFTRTVAGALGALSGSLTRKSLFTRTVAGALGALTGAIVRRLNWPVPDKTLEANRIDLHTIQVSYTDRANIKNTMSARYAKDWSGHESEIEAARAVVTATDSNSVAKYGTIEGEQATLPYTTNAVLAQRVIAGKLVDLANPRLLVSLQGGFYLSDIERGDVIAFSFEDGDELDDALLGLVALTDRFLIFDVNRVSDNVYELYAVRL